MKELILKLAHGADLTEQEAEQGMHAMMEGAASSVQIAAYLTLLRDKGETIAELTGSVRAMREHALALEVDTEGLIDTCGTGGDHSGTFNISTAAAIVAAAGQVRVVKHGNRAASSQTGSADVLTALGVAIDLPPELAAESLLQTGFCFLFAQVYHPAMKYVAPIRKELGYRTMFNILGPLTNPAHPKRQVLGTPSIAAAEKIANVLALLGCERALVVHSKDGLDEISIANATVVYEVQEGAVNTYQIDPNTFGVESHSLQALQGGDAAYNAAIIRAIFQGEKGARRDVVVINAAASLYVAGKVRTLFEGARAAERLIDEGAAMQTLERIASFRFEEMKGVGR